MKAIARLGGLVVVAGCAAGGYVAPSEAPAPSAPAASPAVLPAKTSIATNVEAGCSQAAHLSEVGEHKPAVDSLDAVIRAGATCPDSVVEAVEDSRRRLTDADELARSGLEARRVGDMATARETFQLALVAYPKYYWVQKLVRNLPAEPSQESVALRQAATEKIASGQPEAALELLEQATLLPSAGPEVARELARVRSELAATRLDEARRAQQAGNLPRAIARTKEAIAVRPGQPTLELVVDFARRLGLNLFSTGELVEARDLWQAAFSLDQANELLRQYLDEVQARLQSLEAIRDDGN